MVLPDAEYRTIVSSFFWTKHRNVRDKRADSQTDSRAIRPTVHCERCNSKKLRYREELSASVVLTWCSLLFDISREKNLLTANQPLKSTDFFPEFTFAICHRKSVCRLSVCRL